MTSFNYYQVFFLQVCRCQEDLRTGIFRRHHYFKKYLRIEQFKKYLRIYRKLVLETGSESQAQDLLIQSKVSCSYISKSYIFSQFYRFFLNYCATFFSLHQFIYGNLWHPIVCSLGIGRNRQVCSKNIFSFTFAIWCE